MQVAAQTYPAKPVRILVGFAPGGGADNTARLLAQRMPEALGQNVLVENRPGAAGVIAAEAVAKSPPDGYTMLMMTTPDAVQPALRANMPFDILRDFSAISMVATGPFVLVVHPVVPAKNVTELIALARTKPGRLNYASSGIGSSGHISSELFNTMANIRIIHVPYKGSAEGVTATAAGEVDMVFAPVATMQALRAAGKVKALGVTSRERFPLLAEVPKIGESGLPGYERTGWYGLVAAAQVPRDVIAKLNAAVSKTVNAPAMREAFIRQGFLPQTGTPEEFAAFLREEVAQTAKLVRASGATAN
jgi:tripartite-type tricarboxylate transporter receptor subunit TctC